MLILWRQLLSTLWLPDYGYTDQLPDKNNTKPNIINQTPVASSEMNSYLQAEMAVCSAGSDIQGMRGVSHCQIHNAPKGRSI